MCMERTLLAFVELLDGQDKVLRTVPVVDGKADFYFLNPGKYGARLINDTNGNGVWDTGNYAEKAASLKWFTIIRWFWSLKRTLI